MRITGLTEFEQKIGHKWENIESAFILTQKFKEEISSRLKTASIPFTSTDTELVLFGSLARNECTLGSDVDWTLLIDGQTKAIHADSAFIIKSRLEDEELNKKNFELVKPGTTGMFGQMTFSSDLIHNIGGQDDTSHNLSRRILLLLESTILKNNSGSIHERVLRGIIDQYIDNDSGFSGISGKENIPRFLLNDIIRFWRTMCVDFAYKQKEQKGKKWAIRNIKLRMSRKLIFVKGLLLCCQNFTKTLEKHDLKSTLKEDLYKGSRMNPIDFIVKTLIDFEIPKDVIIKLFNSYDTFLGYLNNIEIREHLTNLTSKDAYNDGRFMEARENSHLFQEALQTIFLQYDSPIKTFTLKYGVF